MPSTLTERAPTSSKNNQADYALSTLLGTLFPQKSTWPSVTSLETLLLGGALPNHSINCAHHPSPILGPYLIFLQRSLLTLHNSHLYSLSFSPARTGVPQDEGILNALIIILCPTNSSWHRASVQKICGK